MDCHDDIGGEDEITDANMLDCLGAIEEKVNEIISKYRSLGCDQLPTTKSTIGGGYGGIGATGSRNPSPTPSIGRRDRHQLSSPIGTSTVASLSRTNLLGEGPAGPMSSEPIYVMPPRLDDENNEEDISRPLTRTELHALTANKLGNVKQPNIRRATTSRRRGSMMPLSGLGRRGTLAGLQGQKSF